MKIKVEHKNPYGKDLFYATDSWTKLFFQVFKPTTPQKSVSLEQLKQLKELGFEIEFTEKEAFPL